MRERASRKVEWLPLVLHPFSFFSLAMSVCAGCRAQKGFRIHKKLHQQFQLTLGVSHPPNGNERFSSALIPADDGFAMQAQSLLPSTTLLLFHVYDAKPKSGATADDARVMEASGSCRRSEIAGGASLLQAESSSRGRKTCSLSSSH